MASIMNKISKESHTTSGTEQSVESKLNVNDLQALQEAFMLDGSGYNNKLSLNKEQFVEALTILLNRGTRQEFTDLFDKIDITGEGVVDWDKFASHLLLELNDMDDRLRTMSLPEWKDQINIKKYKIENPGEAQLAWGDSGGYVNLLTWNAITLIFFERPAYLLNEKEEAAFEVSLKDVIKQNTRAAVYLRYHAHTDWVRQIRYIPLLDAFISCSKIWNTSMVITWLERSPIAVKPSQVNAHPRTEIISVGKTSTFTVHQGINAFDFHDGHNMIATAGVNYHICLWNPYVVSKPNGLLRGHLAPVVAVQFYKSKARLFSMSRDHVVRVWDVQLQVSLQRLTGIFPKSLEDSTIEMRKQDGHVLFFHEDKLKLYLSYKNTLVMLELKIKIRDRIFTHEKPIVGLTYNKAVNQVVTACQDGTLAIWLLDTGRRIKTISRSHGDAELTCLVQHPFESKFYTGSTDGTIKIWDMNGYCHHTLICFGGSHVEVGQVVILKRAVIVLSNSNHFTVFRTTNFRDHNVFPSEWKGGPEHRDDVLAGVCLPPNGMVTGSYDGELIVWNTNSELAARRMTQRCKVATDQSTDVLYNVSRLILLHKRKHITSGVLKGSNLVSCGGNGIVRFWNAYSCILVGEFTAHPEATNIIMCVDNKNEYLATGDVDGNVKVWRIKNYCSTEGEFGVTDPPELLAQWTAHVDMISGLVFCSRSERRLVLVTSSSDCSAHIWTIRGLKIGTFGQDIRWKLEHINPDAGILSCGSVETSVYLQAELPIDEVQTEETEETTKSITDDLGDQLQSDEPMLPDPDASTEDICSALSTYRINTWTTSILGKEYQDARSGKIQRRQPNVISDLPYIHGERTGQPSYGPYHSIRLNSMRDPLNLKLPDFMEHPENYFANKEEIEGEDKLPTLSGSYAREIQSDAVDQNSFLDQMQESLGTVSNSVKQSVTRVLGFGKTRSESRRLMCYVVIGVVVIIPILYILIKRLF